MADMPPPTLYGDVLLDISTLMADMDGNGKPDRIPLSAKVTFAPSIGAGVFVHKPSGATIYADVETITLDQSGVGKITLVATDNPDLWALAGKEWKPAKWNYRVTVTPSSRDGVRRVPISVDITVPGGTSHTLGELLLGDLSGTTTTPSTGTNPSTPKPALSIVPSADGSTAGIAGSSITESTDGLTAAIPDTAGTLNADKTILTIAA